MAEPFETTDPRSFFRVDTNKQIPKSGIDQPLAETLQAFGITDFRELVNLQRKAIASIYRPALDDTKTEADVAREQAVTEHSQRLGVPLSEKVNRDHEALIEKLSSKFSRELLYTLQNNISPRELLALLAALTGEQKLISLFSSSEEESAPDSVFSEQFLETHCREELEILGEDALEKIGGAILAVADFGCYPATFDREGLFVALRFEEDPTLAEKEALTRILETFGVLQRTEGGRFFIMKNTETKIAEAEIGS